MVEVTQADRVAALPFIPRNSIAGQDRDGILSGKYDAAEAIQAFAAHRISSLSGVEALVEALELIARGPVVISAAADPPSFDWPDIARAALSRFHKQSDGRDLSHE